MPVDPDVPGQEAGLRDARRPSHCYQTHAAIDAIRARYLEPEGEKPYGKLNAALGVYLVLTEAANRAWRSGGRGGFQQTRKDLAGLAGVSTVTLDAYVAVFEQTGVLAVERKTVGEVNLPNVWALVDPPPGQVGLPTPPQVGLPLRARASSESKTTPEENPLAATAAEPVNTLPVKRRPNLPFDALVEVCPGTDPNVDGGLVARSLKTIRQRLISEAATDDPLGWPAREILNDDVDPFGNVRLADEVRRRARLYLDRWPEAELTPGALAKHWTRLIARRPNAAGRPMRPSEIATMFDGSGQ